MAEKVPGWLERILLPQISEIKGELKRMDGRIEGMEGRMQGEFAAVHSEIRRLDEKMTVEIKRLDDRIGNVEKGIDTGKRLERIESRISALEAGKIGN